MKTFKITKNSQYIQSINLDKGTYTYSCNVKSDATILTIAFQNEKGVWTDFEIPILSGMWNKKAKLTFDLKEKMVNFDLCKYASDDNRVYVQAPMLEEGTNASTPKSSDLDDLEEIDNNKSQIKAFNLAFEDLENYIDGAFKDGVIDSAEATTIAQLIKTVESENDKMLATYDKLFLNSYLEGTAKTSLQQNKITFVGAVNDVITAINTAITDNKITPTERTNVNNKFNAYKTALADFSTSIENANKAIQDKLNDLSIDRTEDAEQAAKLYADTKAEAERVIAEAYADGIVTTEEQARIDDVNTKLQLAKEYADAQDLLLKAQQEAYADGIVTSSEQATINTAKAYADLKKTESDAYADGIVSAEEARAIADAQAKYEQAKDYADAQDALLNAEIADAKQKAEDAQLDADNANAKLADIASDSKITPSEKQETKKEWDAIVAEYPINVTQANKVSASTTAYTTAYDALDSYITPILSNLTTTSDIVGSVFRSRFVAYYTARTDLLNDIAIKIKGLADSANDKAEDALDNANQAQADAIMARSVTDQFGTIQNGGLISPVTILLRELNTLIETAGLTGHQGENRDQPAFWSGGTYAQAIAGVAKAIIRHDGSVKFTDGEFVGKISASSGDIGVLVVEENGNVAMLDPDTLIPRLVFSKTNLPLIGDLTGGVNSSGGMDVGSGYLSGATSSSVTLSGSTNVTKAGAEVTFSGATISLTGSGSVEPNGVAGYIEVGLRLYIDNVPNNYLGGAVIYFTSPVGQQTLESDVHNIPPMKFTLNKAGVVTFKLESISIPFLNSSLTSASVTASRFDWTHVVQGIKRQQYGLNGMMFFYSNNWFHFTEFGGLVLGGKTDMPGVLAKGRIASSGLRVTANAWGAHNSTSSVSRPSGQPTGSYRVPVNCPNGNYDVNISPRTANRTFYVGTTTATYFEVYFRDQNGNAQDSEFSYTLVGDNY